MGHKFEIGSWRDRDELINQLHEHFRNCQLTDWLKLAAHASEIYADTRTRDADALFIALAAQAHEGALWDLADSVGLPRSWLVAFVGDADDRPHGDRRAALAAALTHGNARCDFEGCEVCEHIPEQVLQ